ncbi:glycosyltransferase [Qipengyuania sp. JC766]|uniref:glycosyltransferase n=1 Tax=Qipengyuania sp. JC766 TaxID=3232139 RepID=UPI00345B2D77
MWPVALLAMAIWRHATVAIAAHGTDIAYHRRGGLKGRAYGVYLALGARLCRRCILIANSRATASVVADAGWTRSEVLLLGTDLHAASIERRHNGKLLFAGRLIPRKGCGWFTREVLPKLPGSISLQVAGTDWGGELSRLPEPDRVEFLGNLSPQDLAKAYSRALAVIVPNLDDVNGEYEGFGLVAAEAAACGAVVLASDHGGLRDAVLDGVTGQLLPPGDADAWVNAIEKVMSLTASEREERQERARQAAIRRFSWDAYALAVSDLLTNTR